MGFAACALAQKGVARPEPGTPDCGSADLCVSFEAADTQFDTPPQKGPSGIAYITTAPGSLKWEVQNKANCSDASRPECRDRISLVSPGRDGGSAIRIATLNLDTGVAQATGMERSQINLPIADTGAGEGVVQWWANSLLIPADSAFGNENGWGASLMSFAGGPGVVFVLGVVRQSRRTFFRAWSGGNGGINGIHSQYDYSLGSGNRQDGQCIYDDFEKAVWYDFVHRIVWSSTGGGRHTIWARKAGGPVKKVLDRGRGSALNQPINTMFSGHHPWLKLGSYHDPVPGQNTSVVHDRIRRGKSADAVRMADFPVDLDAPVTYCAGARP